MAISFVGSLPAVGANNGGNVTLTFSNLVDAAGAAATLLQNDVVVCAYASSGTADAAMSTSSSGWTEVSPEAYANGTIDTNLAVYYKVMGVSPDTSFVAVGPGGASNGTMGVAMAFRGVDAAVLDVAVPTPAAGTATSVPNAPAITPATSGAWPVVIGAGAAAAGATFGHTDLSSTTNHFRTGNHAETNDIAIGIGIKTDWASGAFDPAVWTGGNANASNSWAAFSLALKPGATPTTVSVTAASIAISAHPVTANANTVKTVTAQAITYTPQAITARTQTRVAITAAAIAITAQSIVTNAQRRIAVTAASISATGQAIVVNAKTMIQVTAAVVTFTARSIVVTVASTFASRAMKNLRVQRWASDWRRISRWR